MKKIITVTLIILIVFNLTVTLVVNALACSQFDKQITDANDIMVTAISKTVTDKDIDCEPELIEQYQLNRLSYYLNGYAYTVPFTAIQYGLYDSDGNLICESNDELFTFEIVKDEKSKLTYVCKVLNKEDVYDFLAENRDVEENESPSITKISRKGLECYIMEMDIHDIQTDENIGPTYTFNGKIPDEFETVERSDGINFLGPIGNRPENCGYYDSFLEKFVALSERNYSLYSNDKKNLELSENITRSKMDRYNYLFFLGDDSTKEIVQTIYGSDGEEYHLVSVYSFNIADFFLAYAFIFYLITAVPAGVILGIIYAKGKKKKGSVLPAEESDTEENVSNQQI